MNSQHNFSIDHSQRILTVVYDGREVNIHFEEGAWEKLINELNNPPDLGVEVSDEIEAQDIIR